MNAEGAAVSVSVEVPVRPASTPAPGDAPLPRTGWDVGALVALGFALVLLGALVVLAVRTRLERTPHA